MSSEAFTALAISRQSAGMNEAVFNISVYVYSVPTRGTKSLRPEATVDSSGLDARHRKRRFW
jgi:hypothetical protein